MTEQPRYEPYVPGRVHDEADQPPDPSVPASTWLPSDPWPVQRRPVRLRRTVIVTTSSSGAAPGTSDADLRLAEPPRPVPLAYQVTCVSLGPLGLFLFFMLAVSPMALWILVPVAGVLALVFGITLLSAWCFFHYRRIIPLLRVGEVATVTDVQERVTSTSFTNWPIRRGSGWSTRLQPYTGSGHRATLRFTVGGREGTVEVYGAPYEGAVVLADPASPSRAICVSQIPFSVRPGADGHFEARPSVWSWISAILTLGALAAMIAALVAILLP